MFVWKQVRYIPPSLKGWSKSNDKLLGNEQYGNMEDNSQAWAIRYHDIDVLKYKIET